MSTPHGNIVRANAALCDLLGYSLGELRRIDVAELTHPDDRGRTIDALERFRHGDMRPARDREALRLQGRTAGVGADRRLRRVRLRRRAPVPRDAGRRPHCEARERGALPPAVRVEPAGDRGRRAGRALAAGERGARADPRLSTGTSSSASTSRSTRTRTTAPPTLELYAELMAGTRSFYELEKRFEPERRRDRLGAHHGLQAARATRRVTARHRHPRGHHRAAGARRAAPAVAAHGGDRPARRRRRARLQQPPHGDRELLRPRGGRTARTRRASGCGRASAASAARPTAPPSSRSSCSRSAGGKCSSSRRST